MIASELIEVLGKSGGVLRIENGQLVFDGPAELLERHRKEIAELRPQLVALLSACSCEVLDGFRYLCPRHQDTPTGRCLVEPVTEARGSDLVLRAIGLFGGRVERDA